MTYAQLSLLEAHNWLAYLRGMIPLPSGYTGLPFASPRAERLRAIAALEDRIAELDPTWQSPWTAGKSGRETPAGKERP